jgi:hypothetical protein
VVFSRSRRAQEDDTSAVLNESGHVRGDLFHLFERLSLPFMAAFETIECDKGWCVSGTEVRGERLHQVVDGIRPFAFRDLLTLKVNPIYPFLLLRG